MQKSYVPQTPICGSVKNILMGRTDGKIIEAANGLDDKKNNQGD